MTQGVYIRTEKHRRICRKNLSKRKHKAINCDGCGRWKGKNHKCPTKKELISIIKNLHTPEAIKKGAETRKRLYKEGKLKGSFQKGHSVPKEWVDKARKKNKLLYKLGLHKLNPKIKKGVRLNYKKTIFELGLYKGENHYNWKGGITPFVKARWSSTEYRKWRRAIYKKDNYICQKCSKIGGNLNAHHIKSLKKYPKLMYDLNNGVTWCKDCHLKYHKKYGFK